MIKKYCMFFGMVIFVLFSCSGNNESENSTVNSIVQNPENGITVQNVRSFLVDKNATAETSALFYNLHRNSGNKILIGHQDAFYTYYQNDSSMSDVKKTTGSDPAMIGLDFMFITDKNYQENSSNWYYQQEQKLISAAKEAYNRGMAVTFCWHLREPFNQESFYTSEMSDFQKQNAFKSIIPGGSNHNWYKLKLDKLASVLSQLKGNDGKNIPVIFRPFHELDGNWFWWGADYCTADEYKQVWKFTVNYLRDTKNIHHLLYAYSPDTSYSGSALYLQRYPGDEYADILGMDNYSDFTAQSISGVTDANNKLKMISDLAVQKNKIAALTETGYSNKNSAPRVLNHFTSLVYPSITNNNIKIAYAVFWSNNGDTYYLPTPATPFSADFKSFSQQAKIALQKDITTTSLYTLP